MDVSKTAPREPVREDTPLDEVLRQAAADPRPAWEMIEEGRYRPIRTRGSFPGRELG